MNYKRKNIAVVIAALAMAAGGAINVGINNDILSSKLSLAKVEAFSESEFINGKLYYVNEKLKHRICLLPLFAEKLKCCKSNGDYCDPSSQSTCDGWDPDLSVF